MKNYDDKIFRENLSNHELYISTLYENDTMTISKNITKMMQDSCHDIAPVIRVQLNEKKQQPLSQNARQALEDRDKAHKIMKENPTIENSREFKNLRNTANSVISKERYTTKREKFKNTNSLKNKWNTAKMEIGQSLHTSPTLILEGLQAHTKPRAIASSLNRQYLSNIRKTINQIPKTSTNPIDLYKKALGPVDTKLDIQQLSMSQLKTTLSTMSSTSSSTSDFISMKLIKDAGPVLNPHILHLINKIISNEDYPSNLKVTKVIPIQKPAKDPKLPEGWRPINIVPSLSKVVEKSLLLQVLKYLKTNELIHHTHHGSVAGKSTQTLIQEVYDRLLTSLEEGKDSAFVQLDQSKAYDVIDHEILIKKMQHLGFNKKAINIFKSYMFERKQYVVVESFPSELLLVGPRSVTQGSTLSCMMYLLYIMDITQVFHQQPHNPQQYLDCKETNAKTFVDDNFLHIQPDGSKTLKEAIQSTMDRIIDYTNANLLSLNPDKSKIMLITNNQDLKDNFTLTIGDKDLKHQKSLMVLGNVLTEDLSWEKHIHKIVIPALQNRARTLKYVSSFMDPRFRRMYVTAIFKGKLNHAIDAWGGTTEANLTKIQAIQDKVTKVALGHKFDRLSSHQREAELGWRTVRQEVKLATLNMAHKVAHANIPEELNLKMPLNARNLRLKEANKFDTKPRCLDKNKLTRASFRNRAYIFNTLPNRLTAVKESKRFSKWLKVYLKNPGKLPKPIPKLGETRRPPNQMRKRPSPVNETTTPLNGNEPARRDPNQTSSSHGSRPGRPH